MALHSTVSLDYISDLSSNVCSYELVPPYCSVSNPMSPLTPLLQILEEYSSIPLAPLNIMDSRVLLPPHTSLLYSILYLYN